MKSYKSTDIDRYAKIMLEHTSVGYALYDAQTLCLLDANAVFLDALETCLDPCWQRDDLIGRSLAEWGGDAHWGTELDISHVLDIFKRVAETGVPYHGTNTLHSRSEQNKRYWSWSVNPAPTSEGTVDFLVQTLSELTDYVLAWQSTERDYTQRSKVIEAERKRLEVIETVARSVRGAPDTDRVAKTAIEAIHTHFRANTIGLYIADPAQKMLHLLRSHTPTTERDQTTIARAIPYEQLVIAKNVIHQRDHILIEDIQEGPAHNGELGAYDPLMPTHDHGYLCVPLWFGDRFEGLLCATFRHALTADGSEAQALVEVGTHIAAALAHARLHTQLERANDRQQAILEQLPEGVLIAEVSDGSISYANQAAATILGLSVPELTATPLHQHSWLSIHEKATLDGQRIPPWNFVVIRALCGETIRGKETLVVRPDGSKLITLTSSAPLQTEDNIVTGAMIVFQDVTAHKSLEKHKNEFLSIVNHELRTPITIIQGFAEILQLKNVPEQALSDTLTQYALTSINEQSQHLTRLIEELLDISRLEQDKFSLNCASHDLLGIMRRVIDSQAITTKQHHLFLTLEGLQTDEKLIGFFDEKRIIQVLNNLVSNAIKYSPSGGDIEVGLRYTTERPNEVLIWVKDQGIGIAPNELQQIFKRFHRASNIDRSLSGFGIGLYLVKEVVTHHGGRIWVESVEGVGSTFYIVLPLSRPKA